MASDETQTSRGLSLNRSCQRGSGAGADSLRVGLGRELVKAETGMSSAISCGWGAREPLSPPRHKLQDKESSPKSTMPTGRLSGRNLEEAMSHEGTPASACSFSTF